MLVPASRLLSMQVTFPVPRVIDVKHAASLALAGDPIQVCLACR